MNVSLDSLQSYGRVTLPTDTCSTPPNKAQRDIKEGTACVRSKPLIRRRLGKEGAAERCTGGAGTKNKIVAGPRIPKV